MSHPANRRPKIDLDKPISATVIAQLLDNPTSTDPADRWTAKRARNWLKRHGIARRFDGPRGAVYTSILLLNSEFDWLADLLLNRNAASGSDDDARDGEGGLGGAGDYE